MDRRVITMERMIQSATGQVAATYGLADRGVLRAGAYADVLVFDPQQLKEEATYTEPRKLASGMRFVFVNGVAAVDEGGATNALAGKVLRKR
jgi:N-acyl-D-aspartate/D-glutamate deacylase